MQSSAERTTDGTRSISKVWRSPRRDGLGSVSVVCVKCRWVLSPPFLCVGMTRVSLLKPDGGCDAARASRHVLLLRHRRTGARQGLSGRAVAETPANGHRLDTDQHHADRLRANRRKSVGAVRRSGGDARSGDPGRCRVRRGSSPRAGDVVHTDGQPWDCCPRTFLKGALAALEQQAGLRLVSAFEQEFYYEGADERLGSAYSLD